MNEGVQEWTERYGVALRGYLAAPREDWLMQAYDLGRNALALDVPICGVVEAHGKALLANLQADSCDTSAATARGSDFLREALAPFEMGFRGYQEANSLLKQLNETLERRVEERSAALREADRRKDEFLATLAHELRNPLAPVMNSLELMKGAGGDVELVEQSRVTVERQIAQMVRLIDDLLDVNRITRNKLELKPERVELASVVHHAVEACRPLYERAGHSLEIMTPPEPVYLNADPVRLSQVLVNLLTNSCKYTEPGGHVWLTADRNGREVCVTVRDTGIGIPPEMLTEVFDLFTQVDRSLERTAGGLGIGLSLVKRLVEMHGGTVTGHSEGQDRGSEFLVRLPMLVEQVEPEQPPILSSRPTPASGRKILIVDDNRDSANTLALLLKRTGDQTRTAYDGEEAVEIAAEYQPEVILLDIGLPKMNGYEACRAIRESQGGDGIVIVALTGWGQEEDRRKSNEAGFDGHLVKPVALADLMKLLTEFANAESPT
ncbi:MAG TPA: ATP-binding protein [Pirellulaceae bacterium]|nr:ATP-binding protein [Pirellulaceae bacterium]